MALLTSEVTPHDAPPCVDPVLRHEPAKRPNKLPRRVKSARLVNKGLARPGERLIRMTVHPRVGVTSAPHAARMHPVPVLRVVTNAGHLVAMSALLIVETREATSDAMSDVMALGVNAEMIAATHAMTPVTKIALAALQAHHLHQPGAISSRIVPDTTRPGPLRRPTSPPPSPSAAMTTARCACPS